METVELVSTGYAKKQNWLQSETTLLGADADGSLARVGEFELLVTS